MIGKKEQTLKSHHFEAQIIHTDCFHWQIKLCYNINISWETL